MTKAEIIAEVTTQTGADKQEVLKIVEKLFDVIRINMIKGNNVYVRGFGSFVNKKRAQKVARNLSNNTAMVIAEHYIPSLKPSKTFLEKVKKNVNADNIVKTTVKVPKKGKKAAALKAVKPVVKATVAKTTVAKPAPKTTKK